MLIQLLQFITILQDNFNVLKRVWSWITYQFTFGRITVSASSLVTGLIVLIITFTIARTATALLDRRLAKRQHIDPGLRYTLTRLIRYIVIMVGVLLAMKQAFGIDLTSIAVIFTALSVGIGFGLQYIAADIASGFILLFERPIRVGDFITIGEDEGDVESINLRTTTVITNNHIAIVVPNSKLVSQRVVNWTYGDPRARIPIPVSVADDADVKLVTDTLVDAARGIENVLEQPQPKVQFLGFGQASLDLRLLVWTNRPAQHIQIKSDVNFRIEALFKERAIKTPTPKQEMFVKAVDFEHLERDLIPEHPRRESQAPRDPDRDLQNPNR